MNATDFTKNKMHFTIGLLAALFSLHPFFPTFDKINFLYMGVVVPLSWALMIVGIFLALAVYCYATDLMSEHPSPLSQRLGNYLYAMAIMAVPFYVGLWLTTVIEDALIQRGLLNEDKMQTPMITGGILAMWVVVWQLGGLWIRHYLGKKDWTSRVDQLVDKEMDALKRAAELQHADHADLAIVQYYKAVMARLKMATMKRGYFENNRVIANAKKLGIINKDNETWMEVITRHYGTATSVTPVMPGAVEDAAQATKKFLSTVPV